METKDLRNHGDSPHNPRHDYMAMAEDVAGFIKEHKLKVPTLIGHSMLVSLLLTAITILNGTGDQKRQWLWPSSLQI